jgi:phage shock protein A
MEATGRVKVREVSAMGFLEQVVLRLLLWVGLPLALIVLAIGPKRVGRWLNRFWTWLWCKKLEPETILTQVVRDHEKHIDAQRTALARCEAAERDIVCNMRKSDESIASLQDEARGHAAHGDDFGARAALHKLNLEQLALHCFQQQLERQRQHVTEARRRLHLLELQLRQYQVGRSILLSQLAEARTVEQQYAIAHNFDPFRAVATWQRAEGMVQEKAQTARAVEQVYSDIVEIPLAGQPVQVDPAALDAQLAELKAEVSSSGVPRKSGEKSRSTSERNGREA